VNKGNSSGYEYSALVPYRAFKIEHYIAPIPQPSKGAWPRQADCPVGWDERDALV